MRFQAIVWASLAGLALLVGCKQQCFQPECDYEHYRSLIPDYLESEAATHIQPEHPDTPEPTTILNPERKIRYMSLVEAMSLSLEQGTVALRGQFPTPTSLVTPFVRELPLTFTGNAVTGSDAIRVLALDPAQAGGEIEAAAAKFDARWLTSVSWTNTDEPVGTAIQTFQVIPGTFTIQEQQSSLSTSLVKPLPTGGVAGITFSNQYALTNLNQLVNPAYTPTLQFSFEQPLFQGAGTEINQLLAAHPGSSLFQFTNRGRAEGILLTRLRFDQSRVQFEFDVSLMLLGVEAAYWNLYGAYWQLYSREEALRQAYGTWRINKLQFDAGRVSILELSQSRAQYELFRGQRFAALGKVLDAERELRIVTGLPAEDGTRLVPIDTPTVAPYSPDWQTSLDEAMALQPTLILGRQDVKARQMQVIVAKNSLLPNVRFASTYGINSIGTGLDGGGPDNALRNLAQNRFANWSLALTGEIPIGYREANADLRKAKLALAQSYAQLRDYERRVQLFLAHQYRLVFELHEEIKAARAQREAFAQELGARFEQFRAGKVTMNFLLEAQRNWADALAQEYQNIVQYNQTLASFEVVKGTYLEYNNVVIAEGPLPRCAQVRAVEHFRERSKALVLRERPGDADQTGCCKGMSSCATAGSTEPPVPTSAKLPTLPDSPPSLLTLYKDAAPVPEIKEPAMPVTKPIVSISKPVGPVATAEDVSKPAVLSLSKPAGSVTPATGSSNSPVLSLSKPAGSVSPTASTSNGANLPPATSPMAQPRLGQPSSTNDIPGIVPVGFQEPADKR
jgi:outer membrane protein TolC